MVRSGRDYRLAEPQLSAVDLRDVLCGEAGMPEVDMDARLFDGLDRIPRAAHGTHPANPFHAFVSLSCYNAYTPTTPGHVFDVLYDPSTGTATWKDISYDLGDQPITGIAYDSQTGNLYASTDFGVVLLKSQSTAWDSAAPGLPPVAVYGLTISVSGRVLYAATHGRGAYKLNL